MSTLTKSAKAELKLAGLLSKDKDGGVYNGMIGKAVLELTEVFAKQGHSGMSSSLTLDVFDKVARHHPLSPLTGEDSEWEEVENGFFQNKREFAVFKSEEQGVSYIDAILFREDGENTFSGSILDENGEKISSSQKVSFPFFPKTFVIDIERNCPIEGRSRVIDRKQLEEALNYFRGKK